MDNLTDFTDFGTSQHHQIVDSDNDIEKKFTMDDFLNLPHFDDQSNCLQLIASLKSNDLIVINSVNEEPIMIKEISPASVTVKYGDVEISFDKYDLTDKLEQKSSLMESKKTKVKKTKVKDNKSTKFLSDSIEKFEQYFKINRVEQLTHLKSSDEYKNEYTKGDIYKIQ